MVAGWPTIASSLWQASTSREGIAGLRHVSTGIVPLIPQLPGSPSSVTVRETSRTDVTPPRTIAERIAAQAPLGVQATLASARQAVQEGVDAASASLPATMRRLMSSNDAQEGVRAMLERRPGDFQGN